MPLWSRRYSETGESICVQSSIPYLSLWHKIEPKLALHTLSLLCSDLVSLKIAKKLTNSFISSVDFQCLLETNCQMIRQMMIASIAQLHVSGKFVLEVSTSYISNAHGFRHFEFIMISYD